MQYTTNSKEGNQKISLTVARMKKKIQYFAVATYSENIVTKHQPIWTLRSKGMQFFFLNVEGEENGEQQLNIRWMLIVCVTYFGVSALAISPQQPQDSPGITFAVNRPTWQIQVWHVIHHCTRTNFERHQVGLKITESPTEMMARQLLIDNETILPILRRCLYEHWWPQNDVRLCILGKRGAVIWTSKKQSTIGLKAEYVEASREKPCGWNTHGKLGSVQKQPTRNLVQEGIINFESCWDPDQTADVLTKALP